MTTEAKPLPDFETLHRLFVLDEANGWLFWRKRPPEDFPADKTFRFWNSYCAGKRADNIGRNGYYRVRIWLGEKSETYGAHRVIWKMVNGTDPIPEVDHIDRDPTNNRPGNLRSVTREENMQNRAPRVRGRGDVLPACVYPTRSGKFRAQINHRGKFLYLGTHPSQQQAVEAVSAARLLISPV